MKKLFLKLKEIIHNLKIKYCNTSTEGSEIQMKYDTFWALY